MSNRWNSAESLSLKSTATAIAKEAGKKLLIEPEQWVWCMELIAQGVSRAEAIETAGIPEQRFIRMISLEPKAREQYSHARMQAARLRWSIDELEAVLVEVAAGSTLKGAIQKHKPGSTESDYSAFYSLVLRDPVVKADYDAAREIQAESMSDEILDIADDGRNDRFEDEKGVTRVNQELVNRSRLRVESRKWLMEKLHQKRWGAKSHQQMDVNLVVDHASRLEEARKRKEQAGQFLEHAK